MAKQIKRRGEKKKAMFTRFDKANIGDLRWKLTMGLAKLEKELGIKFKIGNIRYGDFHFSSKIEGILPEGKSKIERDYELIAGMRNLLPIGSEVIVPGLGSCTIIGFKSRATKYPLIVTSDGKRYKLPQHYAQKLKP